MLWQCAKKDAVKNFFPLPNEIFSLGLSSGALAVYSYLLYCENRKTYQCYPSYTSIGKSVSMSVNTVRKYVAELEEQGLVVTEPTSIMTKDGRKRNGSLCYTILPIQNAVDLHNQRQLQRLEETTERMRVGKKLETIKEHPV
ncbi:MAG: helix-turn-helix domain-containing protein [Dysosmobacter sp.]|nr:helix-turn-helix domain-containing protein [Dysosmobacter sp.]